MSSRRALAALVAVSFVLAACGDDDAADTTAAVTDGGVVQDDDVAESSFPVTLEHAFGQTTIEDVPERVVTVGFTDHDVVLALGVTPVAVRNWFGDVEYVWPWAEDELGEATPVVLAADDLAFEQIAALQPDLILGLYAGLEEAEYTTLSEIAPTVAQSGEYPAFGTPWQEMTRTAGIALGRADEADALVGEVEALFAAARDAHPEFGGVGLAYAGVYGEEQYYVETEGSTRMQVLLVLGFVVPQELSALGDDSFFHEISTERLDLLDQDVVLWEPADLSLLPAIDDQALYQSLAVAQEGREVFLSDPLEAAAMAHSTVLSLPFLLERLVPALAEAVGRS